MDSEFDLRQGLEGGYEDLAKREYQEFKATNSSENLVQFDSLWKGLHNKCRPVKDGETENHTNAKLQYIHVQCCYLASRYNPCPKKSKLPQNINFDMENFCFMGRNAFFLNINKNYCKECKKTCNTKCGNCKNENFHYKCLSAKKSYLTKDLLCLQCGKFRSVFGRKRGGNVPSEMNEKWAAGGLTPLDDGNYKGTWGGMDDDGE